jgi:hypothetical protein
VLIAHNIASLVKDWKKQLEQILIARSKSMIAGLLACYLFAAVVGVLI